MTSPYRSVLAVLAALVAVLLSGTSEAATDIIGQISTSQTWTPAGNPYRLIHNTQVSADATLTLAAGVIVEAQSSYQLIVYGALSAQGTAQSPVILRYKTPGSPGAWLGISLQPGSRAALAGATVSDATTGITGDGTSLALAAGSSVSGCRDDGLSIAGATTLSLQDSTFTGNGRDGVHLNPSSITGSVQRCGFTNNGRYPVFATAAAAGVLGSGNAYSGNGAPVIGVACNGGNDITGSSTWSDQSIPYYLGARPATPNLFVSSGGNFTVGEGVTVEAGGVYVSGGGTLTVAGTSARHCRFTSGAISPVAGDWPGISLDPGASANLSYCDISYAVRGLSINSCSPTIRHCQITNCKIDGFTFSGSAGGTVGDCTVGDNGQDGVGIYSTAVPNLGQTGIAGTGNNVLRSNARHAVHNQSTTAIWAQGNYWGTGDRAQIDAMIFDHTDLATAGAVTYLPIIAPAAPIAGIEGTDGWGAAGFVSGQGVLSYTVYFENAAPAGSAAVRDVVVTDNLPPELDWTSVALSGSSHPTQVQFASDPATGRVSCAFVGINLPPNLTPGTRQGWVMFSAMPSVGLPTGRQISNQAAVAFDYGTPVNTGSHVNTIDAAPPTSIVTALPAISANPSFSVQWSGADDAGGSGLASYTVYVSDNGGAFAAWQTATTATSATCDGATGHTYGFYVVATDNVGNRESAPVAAQATTTVGTLTTTFPAGTSMVAIPVVSTVADPKTLGFAGNSWFRWNPATRAYVGYGADPVQYTWLAPGESLPGKGFWARFAAATTAVLAGTTLPTSGPYAVHLDPGASPGWVQVGAPFLTPSLWRSNDATVLKVVRNGVEKSLADAAAAGWVADYAWGRGSTGYELVYDPTVAPVGRTDRFAAWRSYWVKAFVACDLVLTAATTTAATRSEPAKKLDGWQVRLVARVAGVPAGEYVLGQVGQDTKAVSAETPPDWPGFVRVASVDEERRLAVDLRPASARSTWEIEVATDAAKAPVTLSWPDLSALPHGVRPVLVDEATGRRVYLRTSGGYTYQGDETGCRRLRVELITDSVGLLTVSGVTASSLRGGGGAVAFTLSAEAAVTARIINISGVAVRSLCTDRAYPRGTTRLLWDGRTERSTAAPTGLYLVELRARDDKGQEVRALVPMSVTRR